MNWSDLIDNPDRLHAELDRAGITPTDLVLDLHDVDDPYVQAKIAAANRNPDRLLRIALEWFGDEGHDQPVERREWTNAEVIACLGPWPLSSPFFGVGTRT